MSELEPNNPNKYDTTDPVRLARIAKLAGHIRTTPKAELAPEGWLDYSIREEKEQVYEPKWKVVQDPINKNATLEAAPVIE